MLAKSKNIFSVTTHPLSRINVEQFSNGYTRYIHMGRVKPKLDERVSSQLEHDGARVRSFPFIRKYGLVELPVKLEAAAGKVIKKYGSKEFRKDVSEMAKALAKYKVPDDKLSIKTKIAEIKGEIEARDMGDAYLKRYWESEYDEDRIIAHCELKKIVEAKLQRRRRDWHYIEYDEYTSAMYMAARLAPNYAGIRTVMVEIQKSDPNFQPLSVMDFGSGMGTTMWAVNDTWPNVTNEFLNVDISKDQCELAEFLLRGGKEHGDSTPGVFFRNYLPTSHLVKYDMVVCAYSLLDLPGFETRVNIIENLWRKTKNLLVLIERGTKGGFSSVAEARHLVLDMSGHDIARKIHPSGEMTMHTNLFLPGSHVLAPCPHEFTCPRLSMSRKRHADSCSFQANFEPLEIGAPKGGNTKEYFSFVVLRKGPHPSLTTGSQLCEPQMRWPRIVEPRRRSARKVTHKLCCPNGNLAELVCTACKYGKSMYKTAQVCQQGDLLPIQVDDTYGQD